MTDIEREAKIAAIAKREQVRATVKNLMESGRLRFTDDEVAALAACIDNATPLSWEGLATVDEADRAWRHNGGVAERALSFMRDGIPQRLLAALRAERERAAMDSNVVVDDEIVAVEALGRDVAPIEELMITVTSNDTRESIIASQIDTAREWEQNPALPIFVTRIGKWVVRLSSSANEADMVALGIQASLRAHAEIAAFVPRLVASLRATKTDLEAALAELHPEALARRGRCKHCRAKLDATWNGEHRDGCAWLWLGGGDVSLLHPQQAKPLGEDVPR